MPMSIKSGFQAARLAKRSYLHNIHMLRSSSIMERAPMCIVADPAAFPRVCSQQPMHSLLTTATPGVEATG